MTYRIDWLVHFSALLSAVGENNVPLAIRVNIEGNKDIQVNHNKTVFITRTVEAKVTNHFKIAIVSRLTQCDGVVQAVPPQTVCA